MRKVDGLIIMGEHIKQEYLLYYRQQMIPYVLVGKRNFDPLPHLSVTSDFHSGAYKATNYIIKKGRRRVVYIQGLVDTYHENERFAGYCKALLESKIEMNSSLLIAGNWDQHDRSLF